MRHLVKALSLLLLLIGAQQGALVHEIGHLTTSPDSGVRMQSDRAADMSCALCPVFAQVVTPAFSHTFQIPRLAHLGPEAASEPRFRVIDASVPRPRSRGPPLSS